MLLNFSVKQNTIQTVCISATSVTDLPLPMDNNDTKSAKITEGGQRGNREGRKGGQRVQRGDRGDRGDMGEELLHT